MFKFLKSSLKNNLFSLLSALVLISLSLSGCNQVKKLDQMGENTSNMATTTAGMAKTTEGLAEVSGNMDEQLMVAVQLARAGAIDIRQNCMKNGLETESFEAKVKSAGCMFQAQQFQLWTNTGRDDLERRDELFKEFADDTLFDVSSYHRTGLFEADISDDMGGYLLAFLLKKQGKALAYIPLPGNVNIAQLDNLMMFYAETAALHYVNDLQPRLLKLKKNNGEYLEVESGLTLIEKALKLEPLILSGELKESEVPKWVYGVLSWKKMAYTILKARVVTLATTSSVYLSRLPYQSQAKAGKFLLGLTDFMQTVRSWGRGYKPYTINFDTAEYGEENLGIVELWMYADWMKMAVDSQKFLIAMGQPAKFSGISKNLVRNYQSSHKPSLPLTLRDQAIKRWESYRDELASLTPDLKK